MVYFIKGIADSSVYKCPQRDKNTINQAHYRRRYPQKPTIPWQNPLKNKRKKEFDWISPSSKIQGILKDGFHAEFQECQTQFRVGTNFHSGKFNVKSWLFIFSFYF